MSNSRYDLLKQLEAKLLAELESVRAMMSEYQTENQQAQNTIHNDINGVQIKTKKEPLKAEGKGKGSLTWDNYILMILHELGGKRKTRDVIDYAIKANPKLDEGTVADNIRGKMSQLAKNKKIVAVKGERQSEGYLYYIDEF